MLKDIRDDPCALSPQHHCGLHIPTERTHFLAQPFPQLLTFAWLPTFSEHHSSAIIWGVGRGSSGELGECGELASGTTPPAWGGLGLPWWACVLLLGYLPALTVSGSLISGPSESERKEGRGELSVPLPANLPGAAAGRTLKKAGQVHFTVSLCPSLSRQVPGWPTAGVP